MIMYYIWMILCVDQTKKKKTDGQTDTLSNDSIQQTATTKLKVTKKHSNSFYP